MPSEAAQTIPESMETPAPYAVRTALSDCYVLQADGARRRRRTGHARPGGKRSDAAIQDAFNRHGVQIMSPHYEADPAAPKRVAETDWCAAPARGPG